MIRLSETAAAETIDIDLPAMAEETMVDGKRARVVPVITIDKPSAVAWRAAMRSAQDIVPGRDEGEAEADYIARVEAELAKLDLQCLVARVGETAGIGAVLEGLAYTRLAVALVRSWTGFGDADGQPVEPNALYVTLAMKDDYIARRFEEAVRRPIYAVTSEGNV
ncbi:hypothetical protein [Maricaulis sp.]|uniref:hypothetical protein n=1 Tax=Maricaulis sp. TaxID=1486257 RepID=UPI003A8E4B36